MTRAITTTRTVNKSAQRIIDHVNAGAQFHSPYLTICANAHKEISPSLPYWAQQYLQGYSDALLSTLWTKVDFRYQMRDGSWISVHEITYDGTDDSNGRWIARHDPPSAFFWTGTERPFTEVKRG